MTASLRLFNAVISGSRCNKEFEFLSEYGVVITPSAYHKRAEIKAYLKQSKLDGVQLNSSFQKSWYKVKNASLETLAQEQILHYLTTYGFNSLGIYNEDYVYVPPAILDLPERLPIFKIQGLPKGVLMQRCIFLLGSGVAMEQQTIEDVLEVLGEYDYQWSGKEVIRNKEAQAIIASRTGFLPTKEEDLFRCLFYQATESTLVIKNEEAIELVTNSKFVLPSLSEEQKISLASGFNRRKPLWMAFKLAHGQNEPVVNRISKLSKKHHKPLPVNILSRLTTLEYTLTEVEKAARSASNFALIKAINALRLHRSLHSRYYRIRNGKGWFESTKKARYFSQEKSKEYEKTLISYLRNRLRAKTAYIPRGIHYAAPTSLKQFSGAIPRGSRFEIPTTGNNTALAGIYWQGDRIDLDLKAENRHESVGWNRSTRNEEIMFSGDVTSAPKGATEWMYCGQLKSPYVLKVNGYATRDNEVQFKILLGYSQEKEIENNYIINPNNLLFEIDSKLTQREKIIGVLAKESSSISFTLIDTGSGESRVSSQIDSADVLEHITEENALRLGLEEIVNTTTDEELADVSLDPKNLTKDSIITLVSKPV